MKTCQVCTYQTPRDEATCPCCGEASWVESAPALASAASESAESSAPVESSRKGKR